MISRETENVKSSEEIESAFRALSAENKPYVTKEELYQVRGTRAVTLVNYIYVPNSEPHCKRNAYTYHGGEVRIFKKRRP